MVFCSPHDRCVFVCVHVYVCLFHVRTRVCMHVIICMYVCMCCRRRYVRALWHSVPDTTDVCLYVCLYMYVCSRTDTCMYACDHMYVCMCCRRRYVHYGILFPILQICVFVRVHVYVCLFTYGHVYV